MSLLMNGHYYMFGNHEYIELISIQNHYKFGNVEYYYFTF